jgi:hypothetical protein
MAVVSALWKTVLAPAEREVILALQAVAGPVLAAVVVVEIEHALVAEADLLQGPSLQVKVDPVLAPQHQKASHVLNPGRQPGITTKMIMIWKNLIRKIDLSSCQTNSYFV